MSFSSAELIPEKSVLTLKVKMFMTTVLLLRLCWQLVFSFVICQELEEGVVFNVYGRRRRDRTVSVFAHRCMLPWISIHVMYQ